MTLGTMAVDHEMRIDYDKLRKDRLAKTREQMEKDNLGAMLVYEPDNIRYITSVRLGEWSDNKMARYALLPRGQEPILFEIGSAVRSRKALCPWMKDIRPAKTDMRGTMGSELETIDYSIQEIVSILQDYGLDKEPLGVDKLTVPMMKAFQKYNIQLADGQETMLKAQTIKTKEEIQCLEISASMVDGAYWDVFNMIKPGIRENEVYAMMRKRLYELGAENVHNVNVISGDRAYPHPHDFSDRIIRPGDMVFLDVVNDFNGYKTCYYRTFVCGKPTERQKRIYKQAYDWLYDAINLIKPGVMTDEVVKKWPTYKEMGYENEFETLALQIGHGVGISHWSKPIISHQNSIRHPEELKAGMHLALETYYGEEGDAARIEEQVVITEDGHKVITKFPCDELLSTWDY